MTDRSSLAAALRALGAESSGEELGGEPAANVPDYLPEALQALATGLRSPEPVPADQRGWSWLLQDVAALVPGATVVDEVDRSGLVVTSLGRALLIDSEKHWSIVAWPPPATEPAEPRVIGTFDPSEEQIRAWAADPGLRFTIQDEELAIIHPRWLDLVLDLAADPAGPRRALLRAIARCIVALPGAGAVEHMTRARDHARATGDPELRAWADELDQILSYAGGHGPVSADEARLIARLVMLTARPKLVLDERADGPFWIFDARFSNGGPGFDRLVVHAPTGNLGWAPRPDAPADYTAIAEAPARLSLLDPEYRPTPSP